jgi:hypothetical protein
VIDRAPGTDAFLRFASRHFVPGYFRNVPSGRTPKSDQPRRDRPAERLGNDVGRSWVGPLLRPLIGYRLSPRYILRTIPVGE